MKKNMVSKVSSMVSSIWIVADNLGGYAGSTLGISVCKPWSEVNSSPSPFIKKSNYIINISVCWLVGWSACNNFLKRQEVALACSFRSTFCKNLCVKVALPTIRLASRRQAWSRLAPSAQPSSSCSLSSSSPTSALYVMLDLRMR